MSNRGRHKIKKKHLIERILGIRIANRIKELQKQCDNTPNLDVFLENPCAARCEGGFLWDYTKEGWSYWQDTFKLHLMKNPIYIQWKNDRSKRIH